MIKFSKDFLQDRILACWVGKNIGGTIGTPYEGKQELFDVKGFAVKPGEPLPNDDLDLQLVWLRAMDELGPENVNANTLGEYWLSYIGPHWNEYGNGKANLRRGFFPPLSGELNNEAWKHSNGAWIRTEIWACLYPLQVEKAIRYAFTDACVDHGYGEGSNAALFIAAMESTAFAVSDIQTLLQIGLSKIPETCRRSPQRTDCDGRLPPGRGLERSAQPPDRRQRGLWLVPGARQHRVRRNRPAVRGGRFQTIAAHGG